MSERVLIFLHIVLHRVYVLIHVLTETLNACSSSGPEERPHFSCCCWERQRRCPRNCVRMGCFSSKEAAVQSSEPRHGRREGPTKDYRRPTWTSGTGLTASKLQADRTMFWDTQPAYGGSKEIWTAIKAACEAADFDTCKLILEAAEVIVASKDMAVCYDQRGFKYELPQYVLSDPTDLVQD